MQNQIELYIHTDKDHDPKLIKVPEDATVEDVLKAVSPEHHAELHLSVEDADSAKGRHERLCDCGVHHRHHVHCHRCRHIQVTVSFNGVEHEHQFSPSTTIERVLKWALQRFNLKGQDAARKVLRLTEAPEKPLPEQAHIGSFAKAGACAVHLSLTDDVNVNGGT